MFAALLKKQGYGVAALQLFGGSFLPPWAFAQGGRLSPLWRLSAVKITNFTHSKSRCSGDSLQPMVQTIGPDNKKA